MASTGDTYPGTGSNVDRSGKQAWSNPTNIEASGGFANAQWSGATGSDYLVGSNYGFAIPAGTIDGVKVTIRSADFDGVSNDVLKLQLQDAAGSLTGNSKSTPVLTNSYTIYTLGGASDLWGATLTPAIVNDVDFGVRLWSENVDTSNIGVQYIQVDVTYTPSATATPPTETQLTKSRLLHTPLVRRIRSGLLVPDRRLVIPEIIPAGA